MSVSPARLPEIAAQLVLLEEAVNALLSVIDKKYGRPNMFKIGGDWRPRYPWPREVHARALKAVRVVSGLHAVHTLLEAGFVAESAMLYRAIDDFLEDIDFLRPNENGQLADRQHEFIEQYFCDDDRPIQERVQDPKSPPRVPRRKIRAHAAQKMTESVGDNDVHGLVGKMWVVDEAWSGSIHGSYPSTMDLFGGVDRARAKFHMRGMTGTPLMPGYVDQFAFYVHRSLTTVSLLALDLSQTELSERLLEARIAFEASDAYP